MTSFLTSARTAAAFTQINRRNELLTGTYAAIDTEYRLNQNNKAKPYTIFAVAIVDSLGNVKVRHESNFAYSQCPEKETCKLGCI